MIMEVTITSCREVPWASPETTMAVVHPLHLPHLRRLFSCGDRPERADRKRGYHNQRANRSALCASGIWEP